MKKILLSKNKIKELQEELARLEGSSDKQNKEQADRGGSSDSWHETAAFKATKEAVESRVSKIKEILKYAMILEEVHSDTAILGSWISLLGKDSRDLKYRLVHPIEADPLKDMISIESPLGKKLLGVNIGDKISINDSEYTVVQLS